MPKKILVIEDDQEMAENIVTILELAQYEVSCAFDGRHGLESVHKVKPDMVICDIMMPGMDGYAVLRAIQSNTEISEIPFIFLTAKSDAGDFRAGMNLGADDYITKPFDGIEFLKTVALRLKRNQFLRTRSLPTTDMATLFSTAKELKEFRQLTDNRPVREFKKKEVLFMEGQSPNELYLIQRGQVKTYKTNYDGKELITGIFGEGEFVGYLPILENRSYNDNAEAMEALSVVVIAKNQFLNLVYSSRDVASRFFRMLSNSCSDLENRLIDIAYQSVRQRVARELIKLDERLKISGAEPLITMGRRDISNLVGTATESLNRTLLDFKDETLIDIFENGIKIKNLAKLERIIHV